MVDREIAGENAVMKEERGRIVVVDVNKVVFDVVGCLVVVVLCWYGCFA